MYISCTVYNGENTNKNDIMLMYVRFLVHMQKEEGAWFKPYGVKVLNFLIQKFSLCLNLYFSVTVTVGEVFIFRSCSIIINLSCLPNVCSLLLKCLHASMAFGFLMSLCLFL